MLLVGSLTIQNQPQAQVTTSFFVLLLCFLAMYALCTQTQQAGLSWCHHSEHIYQVSYVGQSGREDDGAGCCGVACPYGEAGGAWLYCGMLGSAGLPGTDFSIPTRASDLRSSRSSVPYMFIQWEPIEIICCNK